MGTKAKTDLAGCRIRARPCKTYRFVTLRRWPLACLVDADLSPRVSLGGDFWANITTPLFPEYGGVTLRLLKQSLFVPALDLLSRMLLHPLRGGSSEARRTAATMKLSCWRKSTTMGGRPLRSVLRSGN
jgi:hypothetical protein